MYRLRQMDVDDKVCEQISPGVLEKIYPTKVIEQCVQGSEQWTGTQRRVRQSTALALVLFVMMLALWSRLNQRQVWQKLAGGLSKLHPEDLLCKMSSSALTGRRAELGSQVMEALMGVCCQPIARREQTPEAFFGRYRLMAIDGTLFNVADVEVNEKAFGRSSNQFGKGAYPQVRCVLLAECGSHAVVGMQISRYDESEVHGSHALLPLISRNVLLLVDAGIISAGFVQAVRNRGGHVLNTVNLSSTGDLLLRWKKRVNHLNKILKALLWQKGLGRRQMALFGFVLIVDLLDFTTIDTQETRRQDHRADITLEPPADGFGILGLHDLCKGDCLTELEQALRKAEAIGIDTSLTCSFIHEHAHGIMGQKNPIQFLTDPLSGS